MVRNGAPERRFDLLVVADGFAADELGRFAEVVRALRDELRATPPFAALRGLVNVSRLDRVGPADVVTGTELHDDRLLVVDEERARRLAGGTGADTVLVVAKRTAYAGYGGSGVAATTLHEQGARLALHELGHSAFGLADEYGGDGPAASGPGEPDRVNVSRTGDPSRVKWADLVTPDGLVGCYEGADRVTSGMFRPSRRCRMRSVHDPFCPVCAREISRILVSAAHPAAPH